mmetsp:Transcript_14770/g.19327  ORF Transcript_14770/g.19327 Transcript_14770/m.19327 type:complete len:95 (-) Transcript_14770:336-620(-)|eukprot:CAMPEP_0198137350 /NCGR_PEP_ID=MMETSP1443-20131203/861_1 /TAXON_ID=186043 /ORGANISM="Entomoneis sp., Strain CCMP2396" /LENGTH=94 /DNA_ID=CAMNT_0043798755 /DNA_START=215 /DNA_END=499 /DNA_ORIENTATION=-
MSKVGLGTRVLDVLHKGTVLGLMSFAGFQLYQILNNVREFDMNSPSSPHANSNYFEETEKKMQEESAAKAGNDYLDRYRDENYLKDQVKAAPQK